MPSALSQHIKEAEMATKKETKKQAAKPTKKKTTKKKQAEVIRGMAALRGDKTVYND